MATAPESSEVERLKQQPEIQAAMQQAAGHQEPAAPPPIEVGDQVWLGTYALVFIALVALYYELGQERLAFAGAYIPLLRRLALGGAAVLAIMALTRGLDITLVRRIDTTAARHDLRRVLWFAGALAVALIGLTALFEAWYTAAVSFGVISLVLGLALQTPLSSLFGWIYILVNRPYRVGDRIEIGGFRGDVIDVGYLATTLWEFGGPYLSTQHPSGRIIKFPNSRVLDATVINYSWPLFPYVWNEVRMHVAYDSDLNFVEETMRAAAAEEVGEFMMERVRVYRELLAQTPVDELEITERPSVQFRPSDNTWIEAIVRYVVHPKQTGRVRSRLTKKLIERLNAAPEKVLFPKSNMR